jgi:hypothetical protein
MMTRPARFLRRLLALTTSGLLSLAACGTSPETTSPSVAAEAGAPCESAEAESPGSSAGGQCRPEGVDAAEPIPTAFDCGQPAPLVPCCKALLPRCTACADRNREVEAAWLAACKPSDAQAPEATPAIVPPAAQPTTP